MTIIAKEIAQAAATLRNEVRSQVWAALVGEKRPLSQLKLHVAVGKDVHRFKDVADLIERANAVHKANARALSGTGVNVFDEVLAAKITLQRGARTEDVVLSLVRGKLAEVIAEGAVPTKVVKKGTAKRPSAADIKKENDNVHKVIAEVAGGKKLPAASEGKPKARGQAVKPANTKAGEKKPATRKPAVKKNPKAEPKKA